MDIFPSNEGLLDPSLADIEFPRFGRSEARALIEVVQSGRLGGSLEAKFIRAFETGLRERLGVRHALAVSSATAGLHMALQAAGAGDGDDVAVDPFVKFGAHAAVQVGARPIYIDVDPATFQMSAASLRERITSRTKAVISTAFGGLAPDTVELRKITAENGALLIEDCAQALLARSAGVYTGTTGDIGVFSFQDRKHISTGEGGMVVTSDDRLHLRLLALRSHGWQPDGHQRRTFGWNYRMTELCAAVGVVQLERVDEILARYREIATIWNEAISGIEWLEPQHVGKNDVHVYYRWMARIGEPERVAGVRRALERTGLHAVQVGLDAPSPVYLLERSAQPDPVLDRHHPAVSAPPGTCPNAEALSECVLGLRVEPTIPISKHRDASLRVLAALT